MVQSDCFLWNDLKVKSHIPRINRMFFVAEVNPSLRSAYTGCNKEISSIFELRGINMNMNERTEVAVKLKHASCNCCQAVVLALSDLTPISEEALKDIASGFGSGMGNMEATCGALVGAGIAAGIITEGKMTVRYTRRIVELFRNKCGAVTCADLKGRSTGRVLCSCDDCVKNAVLSFGEVFGMK